MIKLISYLIISILLANSAVGQIIVINPGDRPTRPPIEPPESDHPIPVRPDPTKPGGGDFDGKFYEYCGPSWLGYKCNFMRSDAISRMRDESNAYKTRNLDAHQKRLNEETEKVEKDLAALREGLGSPNSPAGINIKAKRDATVAHNASAEDINDSTLELQITAAKEISSSVDISFGLAYKEDDRKEYEPEAKKVNLLIADRFIQSKIKSEQARADAIEAQIRNGVYSNKEDRLNLVRGGRAALEISAQSLQQGDTAKSNFALKVGTAFLDTAISVTPILGWAKDGWEAVTGKNLLTGEKLSGFERTMAVVGVLTAGIGSKLAIGGKAAVLIDVLRAGKPAEESAEVVKAGSYAAEIAGAAVKVGIKDKKTIDEVAAAVKDALPCAVAVNSFRSILFSLIESTAYACPHGSNEEELIRVLEAASKWSVPADDLARVANGATHVFGPKSLAKHKMEGFLEKFGGDSIGAFKSLENAAQRLADDGKIQGLFRDVVVNVKETDVTVRGNVIDGVAKLSTAFIP
ncbi:pre-toxin TG domain-containing protein [Oligoflexus tunisiensis]|uniref:pre-toxin TG domain-containing protein n=1 Tax=Oligoflexus tunisiensis TaxID=708132 RepID=UPI00114D159B|nr:pre-toxin TG domain-containing protein [Oligoflexus tunisiensis]